MESADAHPPQDPSGTYDSFSASEAAMLEFLAQRGEAGSLDFEAFCAARPDLADELRGLYGELEDIDRLVASARPAPSELRERLSAEGPRGSRYQVRGELARGGMGVILEVWDGHLRRELAMKVARTVPGDARKKRADARFLAEAQITGQLQHPGIVPVHELGLTGGQRAYFTMPRVRGIEFREIIRRTRAREDGWTLQRALGVLIKVCEAVAFAHSRGVLHRDLKPSNVMVGAFGETYVMDWGLARVLDKEDTRDIRVREPSLASAISTDRDVGSPLVTMDGDVIGTPAYMPPEQARGQVHELDQRADIYSIGAMLYELLSGQRPFVPGDEPCPPYAVLQALREGPPAPVSALDPLAPAELIAICDQAMARDPEARYGSALDLARDFEAFLGSRPVAAHEAGLGYFLRLAYRRNRGAFTTAAAGLLVVLAGSALYLRGIQREQGRTQRLADSARAQLLVASEPGLYPGMPGVLPRLEAWLAETAEILARAPRHRASWQAKPADPVLASAAAAFSDLERLQPEMAERARLAGELPQVTLGGAAEAWRRVRAEVASSPAFGGLDLQPQLGLLPLHKDLHSGLWEFWLPLSGQRPEVDTIAARIVPTPEMAVVLVLCPGGVLPPSERFPDRAGLDLQLPPLFVGKYEVTLAQWRRMMNPDHASYAAVLAKVAAGDTNPVETVSWYDAMEFAARLGCSLPSDEAWEYAARAGAPGRWAWLGGHRGLQGYANVADESNAAMRVMGELAPWNDGYPIHAPVGSFQPNPFGLHDMLGNVTEWCRNGWSAAEPPTGPGGRGVFRGGSWYHQFDLTHFEFREAMAPQAAEFSRGLRLVRELSLP